MKTFRAITLAVCLLLAGNTVNAGILSPGGDKTPPPPVTSTSASDEELSLLYEVVLLQLRGILIQF
jgi:hypothetical protein